MKLTNCYFFLISFTVCCCGYGQDNKLKSTQFGFEMMLKDVSKEKLIEQLRFEDGNNANIDFVRFDHIGHAILPLIVSSKLAIPTDSLGLLSFTMAKDSLFNFLQLIHHCEGKIYNRKVDGVLIRVTYRIDGRSYQYYVTNPKITTAFFKIIERKLIDNKDTEALDKFYLFSGRTGLWKRVNGKRIWQY